MFDYNGLKIQWLGHDSFLIKNSETVIIDPFKIRAVPEKADVLLITHEHFDHFSLEDIKKVITEKTTIVAVPPCEKELLTLKVKNVRVAKPGDKIRIGDVQVEAVPAYNLNKFREPGKPFHPKEDQKLGYIVTLKGVTLYHAGDTDAIPEMRRVKTDIALLPVSGTYVMTPQEAAEATRMIQAKLVIPMHYGTIVGSEQDAQKFKELASVQVQILKPEA
jgi:L-ascorbate metabolism protein UlaG (beta-lactamase superfamily)